MALKATIQDAVQTIIREIDDLADNATYNRRTVGVYDPQTDNQSATVEKITVKGFLYKAKEVSHDFEIPSEMTWRFIVASKDLGLSVDPSEEDTITIGAKEYEITQIRVIPNRAGYVFYLRLP